MMTELFFILYFMFLSRVHYRFVHLLPRHPRSYQSYKREFKICDKSRALHKVKSHKFFRGEFALREKTGVMSQFREFYLSEHWAPRGASEVAAPLMVSESVSKHATVQVKIATYVQ
jgi:hypothetical protein